MPSKDEEQLYRHIFESIADGLLLNDLDTGLVVAANPAAAAMHGYDHTDFIGLHYSKYLPLSHQAQYHEWVEVVNNGREVKATATHLRRDSTQFTVEMRATSCVYHGQTCLLSVIRDASAWVRTDPLLRHKMEVANSDWETLIREAQTRGAMEERKRLAQNLHDAVNQSLFSASLIVEVLPRLWQRHPEQVWESLEDLRRLTRGALAEMRGLLVELQPVILTDSELEDLLRLLGDAFTGRTDIPVTVDVSRQEASTQDPLPAEVHTAFYRICQEALINIGKHSEADQVTVQLDYEGERVTLSIRDNGRGFDPEQIPAGHYGLTIMSERAKAAGARLSITSRPDQGTEIALHWEGAPENKAI